jgi:hypothetical protein
VCAGVDAVRKLFLLLFLIPVLSWADCPPKFKKQYCPPYKCDTLVEFSELEYNQHNFRHCESHRCAAAKEGWLACKCENLGGIEFKQKIDYTDPSLDDEGNIIPSSKCFGGEAFYHFSESQKLKYGNHFDEKPITPTPATTTSRISITDAKAQCSDIGFKTGTERFGECVLELMQ